MSTLPPEAQAALLHAISCLELALDHPDSFDRCLEEVNLELVKAKTAYSEALVKRGGAR